MYKNNTAKAMAKSSWNEWIAIGSLTFQLKNHCTKFHYCDRIYSFYSISEQIIKLFTNKIDILREHRKALQQKTLNNLTCIRRIEINWWQF